MWLEDNSENTNFKLDKRFRRKIFSLGPFSVWESIRIFQWYNTNRSPDLLYRRAVGVSEKYMDYNIIRFLYKLLNKIFNKENRVYDVKNTKFVKKYKFIKDIFPDIKRDEKLEKLGI